MTSYSLRMPLYIPLSQVRSSLLLTYSCYVPPFRHLPTLVCLPIFTGAIAATNAVVTEAIQDPQKEKQRLDTKVRKKEIKTQKLKKEMQDKQEKQKKTEKMRNEKEEVWKKMEE